MPSTHHPPNGLSPPWSIPAAADYVYIEIVRIASGPADPAACDGGLPVAPEPAFDPAGAEIGLLRQQRRGGTDELAGSLIAEEGDVHHRDLVGAELQVADPPTAVPG